MEEIGHQSVYGREVRLMFRDEGRFGRISDLRRCLAPYGIRPDVPQHVVREYTYAFAEVSPHDGRLDSLVLPEVNAETMSLFLEEVSIRHHDEFIMMFMDQVVGLRQKNSGFLKIYASLGYLRTARNATLMRIFGMRHARNSLKIRYSTVWKQFNTYLWKPWFLWKMIRNFLPRYSLPPNMLINILTAAVGGIWPSNTDFLISGRASTTRGWFKKRVRRCSSSMAFTQSIV